MTNKENIRTASALHLQQEILSANSDTERKNVELKRSLQERESRLPALRNPQLSCAFDEQQT